MDAHTHTYTHTFGKGSQEHTLLEAKMRHPLNWRMTLFHELVEVDQERLLLFLLTAQHLLISGILFKRFLLSFILLDSWRYLSEEGQSVRGNCLLTTREKTRRDSEKLRKLNSISSPPGPTFCPQRNGQSLQKDSPNIKIHLLPKMATYFLTVLLKTTPDCRAGKDHFFYLT